MKKKKLSIVCQIFAIFFGIILFAGILAWIITSQISKIMEPENLVEMVTDNMALEDLEVDELFDDAEEGTTLAEYISQQASDYQGKKVKITDSDLNEILSSPSVKEFLEDKIGDYVDFLEGDSNGKKPIINADQLYELIDENRDEIEEVTGERLTKESMREIRKNLNQIDFDSLSLDKLSSSEVEDAREVYSTVKKVSGWLPWAALGVCALMILIIAILRGRFVAGTFAEVGIIGLIAAGLVLLLNIGKLAIRFGGDSFEKEWIQSILAGVFRQPALLVLFISIGCILVAIILKVILVAVRGDGEEPAAVGYNEA